MGVRIAEAQTTDFLDRLPNCNFSAAVPTDNVILGAVVYNLQTGAGCTENLDTRFPVASVPKLVVAAALYDAILESGGTFNFDTELTFSSRYWMGGRTDCLNSNLLEQPVNLGELSDIMISCSDNSATWMVMDALGWQTVYDYVETLGINGIGQIIPYSEVDRQKLAIIDARWQDVPISMASRYFRSEGTTGLETYFSEMPQYNRLMEIEAEEAYFNTTTFNTATPRAMARFITKMAQDAPRNDNDGQVARWLFGAMLLTQRQYSSQAFPGTVSVGSKNGFDTGLRAEVNVMFDSLPGEQKNPTAFSIIFSRQIDFNAGDLQPPVNSDLGVLNSYLLDLSPVISNILYPTYQRPPVVGSNQLSTVVVNPKFVMDACWQNFERNAFLFEYRGELEQCWLSQSGSFFTPGDFIGVGLILDNLDENDIRITFVFTDPNGERRSYQTQRFLQESATVYWFHPIEDDQIGQWTVDVFIDRRLVHTQTVEATAMFSSG